MPWEEVSITCLRLDFVKLATQEGANMSELCRCFGISRKTGYKWLKRYGHGGKESLVDQSRRPHTSPNRTPAEMKERVLQIRCKHPAWDGRKIRWLLLRDGYVDVPSPSTITAILRRHGHIDPEESLKHRAFQRFQKEYPNELWQMDFKGYFPLTEGGYCHPQTQGKDERLHRTLNAELISRHSFPDLPACQVIFDAWRETYNLVRPHEALDMAVPSERYQPSSRPFPDTLPPVLYDVSDTVRKVDKGGRISFRNHTFRVGKAFRYQPVAIRSTDTDGDFDVFFCQQRVAHISLHIHDA